MADRRTGPIAYLSSLCRRWGGELLVMPEAEFNEISYLVQGVSGAPDGWHAIDLQYYRIMAADGHANPGAMIHEMGHLFLKEGDPRTGYEPDWIGWEIVLARRARCYLTWSRQNADYLINYGGIEREWRDLKGHHRQRFIADRIDHAKAIGIVSQDGDPMCTRSDPRRETT